MIMYVVGSVSSVDRSSRPPLENLAHRPTAVRVVAISCNYHDNNTKYESTTNFGVARSLPAAGDSCHDWGGGGGGVIC